MEQPTKKMETSPAEPKISKKKKKPKQKYDESLRLFITKIPSYMKRKDLRDYFKKYCYIYISRFVNKKRTRTPKVAEIGVDRREDLEAILGETEHVLPCGSVIHVERLLTGKKLKEKIKVEVDRKVTVKPIISAHITGEKLREVLVEKFGPVESCYIKKLLDGNAQVTAFCGHVTFENGESAAKALEEKKVEVMGEVVEIFKVVKSPNCGVMNAQKKTVSKKNDTSKGVEKPKNAIEGNSLILDLTPRVANITKMSEQTVFKIQNSLTKQANELNHGPREQLQNISSQNSGNIQLGQMNVNSLNANRDARRLIGDCPLNRFNGPTHSGRIPYFELEPLKNSEFVDRAVYDFSRSPQFKIMKAYHQVVENMENFKDCKRMKIKHFKYNVENDLGKPALEGILRVAHFAHLNHYESNLCVSKDRSE